MDGRNILCHSATLKYILSRRQLGISMVINAPYLNQLPVLVRSQFLYLLVLHELNHSMLLKLHAEFFPNFQSLEEFKQSMIKETVNHGCLVSKRLHGITSMFTYRTTTEEIRQCDFHFTTYCTKLSVVIQ